MTTTGESEDSGVPAPRAAVVVVNYGSSALLAGNLPAVTGLPGIDVVVVDSFSTDAERASVAAMAAAARWSFVGLPDNPGFGAAVNAGVAHARRNGADHIVLLNPDATVSSADLEGLLGAVRDDPDLLVSPLIEDAEGNVWFAGGELLIRQGITRTWGLDFTTARMPWVTGACVAFAAELWDRVGGFDDRYFMYWEDVDLSHRVRAHGGRIEVRRDLRAVHQVGGTQEGRGKSDLYCRYNCRNRLLFAAAHLPDADLRRWLRSAPRYAGEVLIRGGRRALLRRPFGPIVAVVRGTVEGISQIVSLRGARALVPFLSPSSRTEQSA